MPITFLTDQDETLHYNEQNLTEEQKVQARANIGGAAIQIVTWEDDD